MSKTFYEVRDGLKESSGRFAFDMKSAEHMNAAKTALKKAGFNSKNRPGHTGGDHVLHVKGKAADIHKVMKQHAPHMHDANMHSVSHMNDDMYGHRLESVSVGKKSSLDLHESDDQTTHEKGRIYGYFTSRHSSNKMINKLSQGMSRHERKHMDRAETGRWQGKPTHLIHKDTGRTMSKMVDGDRSKTYGEVRKEIQAHIAKYHPEN